MPDHASASPFKEHLIISLREPWEAGGALHPAGSLLAVPMAELMSEGPTKAKFASLFTPTARCSLSSWAKTKDMLVLTVLDNVCTDTVVWRLDLAGDWQRVAKAASKARVIRTVSLGAVDADEGNELWQTSYGYLEPPR